MENDQLKLSGVEVSLQSYDFREKEMHDIVVLAWPPVSTYR